MGDAATTVTGLDELRAAARALPSTARAVGQRVQIATANRVAAGARARLRATTKGTGETEAAIYVSVTDSPAKGSVTVAARSMPGRDPKMPFYLEFGTRRTPARPFFLPAVDAERQRHADAMEQETETALKTLFGDASS